MDFELKGSAAISGRNPDGWGYAYFKNENWIIYKEAFQEDQFESKEFRDFEEAARELFDK